MLEKVTALAKLHLPLHHPTMQTTKRKKINIRSKTLSYLRFFYRVCLRLCLFRVRNPITHKSSGLLVFQSRHTHRAMTSLHHSMLGRAVVVLQPSLCPAFQGKGISSCAGWRRANDCSSSTRAQDSEVCSSLGTASAPIFSKKPFPRIYS